MESETETSVTTNHHAISRSIAESIESASWIRQMFEEGARLKKELGEENVFDLTLGNPSAPPPPEFQRSLIAVAQASRPADHRYMTNVGLESTRASVAESLRVDHGEALRAEHIVMSCGAAGGLNVFLKSVLDAGDEVMLLAPYFPEYVFYIQNHAGRVVVAPTGEGFQLDVEQVARHLTPRTRAVIVNTPNNPSGVVYDPAAVAALGQLLEHHSESVDRPVFMVMDEPYRQIRYTDVPHASAIRSCRNGIVITSFSKELGLAGERIGYIAVNPDMPGHEELVSALAISTRILGFVNAPALMQRVLPLLNGATVDLTEYRTNRQILMDALLQANYDMPAPDGAFFVFPAVPGGDDVDFCRRLREERVLCVPGRGFGTEGHIRVSYAVPQRVVERAAEVFIRLAR